MQKNNTLFLCGKQLADVLVTSDSRGNHNIMSSLKYNRLVNVQSASHLFTKNTLFVLGKQLTDTVIMSDCHGNHTIQAMSVTIASGERNVFLDVLHGVQREQNQATIDKYLEDKRQSLQDKLKMATQMYISENYIKALEFYRHALTMIESDSYPDEFRLEQRDVFRIRYALVLCNMGLNLYGPLKTACEMCATLILKYGAEYPSLYLTLGRAKVLLNLYESARIALETGLSVLDDCVVLSHLTFPASEQVIPDTDPATLLDNLGKTLEVCKNVPKPDVKCCYRLCIADSKAIYFNGPSFVGYVNVTCSERCQYNYHRSCWKVKLKTDRVKKPSAILNERCQTDGCSGVIAEIKILDQKLKVNAAIRAKIGRESSSSDNIRYTSDNRVVESRVYKTQFQLPTATLTSDLKPNASAFTPGERPNITLHLKNASKSRCAVFEDLDTSDTTAETTSGDRTVQQSTLKADVPEFTPATGNQSVNSFTKWSTNAESTLGDNSYKVPPLEADCEDLNPNSTPVVRAIFQQPRNDQLIPIDGKLAWTEPVVTESVPVQCHSARQTHTPPPVCASTDRALLIDNLRSALFWAEHVNNRVLACHELSDDRKSTVSTAAQTENVIDKRQKNCLKWIHNTCTPAICHADILQTANQKLDDEVKELKKLLRLEKNCFEECKQKYAAEIDALKSTVADLESQVTAARTECQDYKKNNTLVSVHKILLEQIQCNKNFYLPYLKTFEDKCKHMIWELEDVHGLVTAEGTPSKEEVEDSLYLWRNALAEVESRQRIVMQHYETLLYNITSQQYTAVFQYPGQSLLVEPPSIVQRHFKPLLTVNRRLEQEIANQMTSFYQILSQNGRPQLQLAGPERQTSTDLAAQRHTDDAQNGQGAVPRVKISDKSPTAAVASAPSTSTAVPAQKGTKPRPTRAAHEPEPAQCSSVPQPKRAVQDIVGLDALIEKLQGQFPLIDGAVITEALITIRGQHGGLTGLSSREILTEVKRYLRAKQQRNPAAAPPVVSPWNTINTPVLWHSDQQDTSCTICFDKMAPCDSVKLHCQHLFHSICIKIWLQSNSICPICRSFTTLDDEFPPLN